MIDEPDIFARVDRWKAEREELRQRLTEERTTLLARVAEIEHRLALIGDAVAPLATDASVPAVIRAIMQRHKDAALPAGRVLVLAQQERPALTAVQVNSALFRLKAAGEVTTAGTRGSTRFRWRLDPSS